MTTHTASVAALAMPPTPRQFALVLDPDDARYDDFVTGCRPDTAVLWWGCEVDGRALLYRGGNDGRLNTARHACAEAALDRWSQLYPLRLSWL